MNALFWKITGILLFLTCLILTIDKTRMGLRLQDVASRIAEKTAIIGENEAKYRKELDRLQKIIAEKERRFHISMYSDQGSGTSSPVYAQIPEKSGDEEKLAHRLAPDYRGKSPETLVRDVCALLEQDSGRLQSHYYISPETGLVSCRAAALLEETARLAGMSAKSRTVWNMKDFRIGTTTAVYPETHDAENVPAIAEFGETSASGPVQNGLESVVFDFSASGDSETFFLPENSYVPVGGYYIHFFRLKGENAYQLDYEFPEGLEPEKVYLRSFALSQGCTVRTILNKSVQSFRISIPKSGEAAVLVFADEAFFPKTVTGAPVDRAMSTSEVFPLRRVPRKE